MPVLAAHQPNYLPWVGFFDKMARADCFVIADDIEFSSINFVRRTRIKNVHGSQWLTVPVITKGKDSQLIKEVKIVKSENWGRKHWRAIFTNYHKAPHFTAFQDFFETLYHKKWGNLFDLNMEIIIHLRSILGISNPLRFTSEFDLPKGKTERLVQLTQAMKCDTYLAGGGGSRQYLDVDQFEDAGLSCTFTQFHQTPHRQQFGAFIPALTAIDLLFNEGNKASNWLLKTKGTN